MTFLKILRLLLGMVILGAGVTVSVCVGSEQINIDSTKWAQPVPLKGVPGLYRVTDNLYRSGWPTLEGLRNLKAMGIKTVVNVRDFHSNREEVEAAGLEYVRIHFKAWFPLESVAVRFLKVAIDPKRTPVLVQCWLQEDRSGSLIAIYRVAVQGWTKEEALTEMTEGPWGFHRVLINLPFWVKFANIDRIRERAGIKPPPQKAD